MTKLRRSCLVFAALVAASGCGGGPTEPDLEIRFATDTLQLLQGDAQAVPLKVFEGNNETSQTPVLTIESGGASLTIAGMQVTGTTVGNATIVATLGSISARLPVLVFGHPVGTDVQTRVLGARPYGVAVGPDFALVTQLDGNSVTRYSLNPFQSVTTISVGFVPTGISIDAAGTRAVVANQHDPSAGVIDLTTNTQLGKVTATSNTFRSIFSKDGTRAYVTQSDGSLMVINPVDRTKITSVSVVGGANGVAFGPGDTLLYVTGTGGGISIVNTKTNAVSTTIPASGALQDITFSRDRSSFYVADEGNAVVRKYLTSSGASAGTIPIGTPAFGLAMTPDGKQLWAAQTSGTITVVDVATGGIVRTMPLAGSLRRIAFNRLGSIAIVSDEAGRVIMIR